MAGLIKDNLCLELFTALWDWLTGITRAYSDLIFLNVCPISCDHVQMQQYMWQKLCKNNKKVNKKNKNNGFKPLAATVLLKRQFLKKQICLPECLQALLLLLSHLQGPHLAKHLPALLSPEKSRDESYTFNSKIKKLIQVKMHHRASSSYSVSGNTHKRTLFWFYYTWWKIFLHIREKKTKMHRRV